jgi:hypothetical protein
MADSVNRIVPPSVSLDRIVPRSRERDKENRDEGRKQKSQRPAQDTVMENPETTEAPTAEEDKTKGKNLDINV